MCLSGSKCAESDKARAQNDAEHPQRILLAANACKFRTATKAFTLMAFSIITFWILAPAQPPCLIKGDKVVTLWAIPALTLTRWCEVLPTQGVCLFMPVMPPSEDDETGGGPATQRMAPYLRHDLKAKPELRSKLTCLLVNDQQLESSNDQLRRCAEDDPP